MGERHWGVAMTGYKELTDRDVSGGAPTRPRTIMEPADPETPTTRYAEAMSALSVAQDDMMRDVIRGVMGSEIERAIDTTIGPMITSKCADIAKDLDKVVEATINEGLAGVRMGLRESTTSTHLLESFKSSDMICRLIGATALGFALGLLASVFIS